MSKHWTYSRLADFEKCPALYDGRYRGRWAGFSPVRHTALERGDKLHSLMEMATIKGTPLPGALKTWNPYITALRAEWPLISVEQEVALDRYWNSTGYRSTGLWWRGKMDVECLNANQDRGKVVDWKSGNIYGTNADQVRLYAGVMFQLHPTVEEVEVELVYLDQRKGISETITRADWPASQEDFTRRAQAMLTARTFPAKPAAHCSYCEFGPAKGGPCPAGVERGAGLQTVSTRARVVTAQAPPIRRGHARPGFAAPGSPSSIRGVQTPRRAPKRDSKGQA